MSELPKKNIDGNEMNLVSFCFYLLAQLEKCQYSDILNTSCSNCQSTLATFLQTKKLGCLNCYSFFKNFLNNIIHDCQKKMQKELLQITNMGKLQVPEKKDIATANLQDLRNQLSAAIKAEDYEEAARIRDLIQLIQNKENN
jgi:protein-arginine kinase activator protein McsA